MTVINDGTHHVDGVFCFVVLHSFFVPNVTVVAWCVTIAWW